MNGSERGRSANEFNNILEYEAKKCFLLSGNGYFLKNFKFFPRKILARSISNSYKHIKEKLLL